MCFPPSFFDVMVHLVVHLVPQIQALGPMYLHEMWTYERFMSILNGYVSTRARPEASMIEGYCTEEAIESDRNVCHIKAVPCSPKFSKAEGAPFVRIHVGRLLKFSIEHASPSVVSVEVSSLIGVLVVRCGSARGQGEGGTERAAAARRWRARPEATRHPSSGAGQRLRLHVGEASGLRLATSGGALGRQQQRRCAEGQVARGSGGGGAALVAVAERGEGEG